MKEWGCTLVSRDAWEAPLIQSFLFCSETTLDRQGLSALGTY